ncbi:MAG TPA: glycosyltransferase family 2 protein [Candidatus Hydrogenedentes bacterium]|nr:glycosyltransferase family 2 protein [Candidatus Hydrogenedentota bacterium]HPG67828.1 glycosyltransferase family 2 protein [Candidatus Hydrogenedentota bacterium]
MRRGAISRYLSRHADLDTRPLVSLSTNGITQAVVIPALAEAEYLFDTLRSLEANAAYERERTLVIVVINNGAEPHAAATAIAENQATLRRLDAVMRRSTALRLAYVDASSPGVELPPREGVGLARRIGMDHAVAVLARSKETPRLVGCLDADALVEPNYLEALRTHFERPDGWAAVTAYAHRLDGITKDEIAGILCYELFLRYHALGLTLARSPYAFHTIGSTIACTAEAYAVAGGMNRREAGEDFYFLQKLAKTGAVHILNTTTVHPSGRASSRVPFGTGPRVRNFSHAPDEAFAVYHPECYAVIDKWFALIDRGLHAEAAAILADAEAIAPELRAFLDSACFERTWEDLARNSPDAQGLVRHFHDWFDGLKTLRLIHHLRDHGWPQQDLFESLDVLVGRAGLEPPVRLERGLRHDIEGQKTLLGFLRGSLPYRPASR